MVSNSISVSVNLNPVLDTEESNYLPLTKSLLQGVTFILITQGKSWARLFCHFGPRIGNELADVRTTLSSFAESRTVEELLKAHQVEIFNRKI